MGGKTGVSTDGIYQACLVLPHDKRPEGQAAIIFHQSIRQQPASRKHHTRSLLPSGCHTDRIKEV
ncbi:hypothetical protein J6590_095000 [Homalodisca vitripennis]|nr:hypothetical protein J6590_095000 [Homalodisca vitripennis]